MDTISRENSSNYLPVAGLIVGVIAIVLSCVALVKSSGASKANTERIASLESRVETTEGVARNADSSARQGASAQQAVNRLAADVQNALTDAGKAINETRSEIEAIKAALARRPAPAAASSSFSGGAPQAAVAGADEYIVKGGDTGGKIAAAAGVKLADLMAVNPDVVWTKLAVGQKLKLPRK
ncbi:MAG: LysM peptidoglycan-binding domain-containing protein [Opitutaceae bacterium]|jgi:LysM repeat protein|nr:LysM peptidoglycan-binding domain-containing protein [Opitutaceae bacterium]